MRVVMALNIVAYLLMLPAALFFVVAVVSWPVEPENRTMVKELFKEIWDEAVAGCKYAWKEKATLAKAALFLMFLAGACILWIEFILSTYV